jgi:beta-1,2-mannobiose phosphorylase / 1,2-beta-oligomannan phosphorylase
VYHMWYTGYRDQPDAEMHLGYATSEDGIEWKRYEENPIYDQGWIEDVIVIKSEGIYYMFAEGKNDIAHLLTSTDRIHWTEQGALDIRYVNGEPLTAGAYGTPAVWKENGVWYLFYERGDLGIWLATSTDLKQWINRQDEPVIQPGPEAYDKYGVAVNQIIKHQGKYYAYYHATAYEDWHEWSSCVAISEDLIHWKKYDHNPIMKENKSSPILVNDGEQYRLYTMHDEVCLHFPSK